MTLLLRNIPTEVCLNILRAMTVQGYFDLNTVPATVAVEYRRFVS